MKQIDGAPSKSLKLKHLAASPSFGVHEIRDGVRQQVQNNCNCPWAPEQKGPVETLPLLRPTSLLQPRKSWRSAKVTQPGWVTELTKDKGARIRPLPSG